MSNTEGRALNFGVQSYDQYREIEKLLYLLQKGYRPSKVLFFDGLNDIRITIRNNYNVHDQYCNYRILAAQGRGAEIDSIRGNLSSVLRLISDTLRSLPVFKAIESIKRKHLDIDNMSLAKDGFLDKFDEFEARFVLKNSIQLYSRNPEHFQQKLLSLYKANIEFLQHLSKAFDFELYVFFQPLGLLDSDNSFIRDFTEYTKTDRYLCYYQMSEVVRADIAKGELEMYDMSKILFPQHEFPKYVDPAHYSKETNQFIADYVYVILDKDKY